MRDSHRVRGGLVVRKELWNCNPYLKAAPAQYINEPGILAESGKHISQWGKRALVSGGRRALHAVESLLFPSMDRYEIRWSRHTFVGECSDTNICAIERKIREVGADVLVGVGGGKSLDSAKAAAELAGIPIVTIPTIAATCAAASPTSITYNDGGQYQRDYYMSTNPQLVLVDPEVIANAPLEYFSPGFLTPSLNGTKEGQSLMVLRSRTFFHL